MLPVTCQRSAGTRESPQFSRALPQSPDLQARVTASASAAILKDFRRCIMLSRQPAATGQGPGCPLAAVGSLGDDIRRGPRTGREQQDLSPSACQIHG
jgi:hypothetical protein